jgi:hypothetical protein
MTSVPFKNGTAVAILVTVNAECSYIVAAWTHHHNGFHLVLFYSNAKT